MGDDSLELGEAFQFLAERIETEEDNYGEDIPNHGAEMVVADAADLLQTVTSIEMAHDMAEGEEDTEVDEEQFNEALTDSVVDVVASLAVLQYERDIDIAEGVEDRIDFIKDFAAFQEAMQDADDSDEEMEAIDEYMTEEIAEEVGMPTEDTAPSIGDNVDSDGYDHDHTGTAFQ